MKHFRLLRADEIECRISTCKEKGLSLLLYKDARCDMNILDEYFGFGGWQRKHEVINGNLFCSVGIRSYKGDWIWKQDVGTESYTEKQKGEASDAFKRACFNLGIGRELYSAPFIWISPDKASIKDSGGKFVCWDRFSVREIGYDRRERINHLVISNDTRSEEVYRFDIPLITQKQAEWINQALKKHSPAACEIHDAFMAGCGARTASELTKEEANRLINLISDGVTNDGSKGQADKREP